MIINYTQVYRAQSQEAYCRIMLRHYGWAKSIRMTRVPPLLPPEVGPEGPVFRPVNDAVAVLQCARSWLRDALLICPAECLEEVKEHLANLESAMKQKILAEYIEVFETVAIDRREGDDALNIPDGQILVPPLL